MRRILATLPIVLPSLLAAQPTRATLRPATSNYPVGSMGAPAGGYDTAAFASIKWREIGPYRGGRSVAVAGSSKRPMEYWMGTTGGGVFKTTDGGMNWQPTTDKYFGGTIGYIAVSESNPDIVYVGGGEYPIRGNVSHGDGMWKTTDGGRTWTSLGLRETEQIARVRVHPTNPDIVWVGAAGHTHAPNRDRGIYKSTDGGKTWRQVKFVSDSAGVSELVLDPTNPDILYAAFWHSYRTPWSMVSGGRFSSLWKSIDGGETWTELTKNPGLPKGLIGNVGMTVSPVNPKKVWALIEAEDGGVFRSDDAGATWTRINEDRKLRQRAWYYSRIFADPKDTNVVYALNVGFYKSTNGGRTFPTPLRPPHGDNHDMWIAPNDPQRMIEANDGGANVSFNGGRTWTDQDFATAQFYHISTTNHFPYHICGAQQDNSTLCGPSRQQGGIDISDWVEAGGGESGYVESDPRKPDIVYAGSYGGLLTRKDLSTGFTRNVSPWPDNPMGYSSEDIKYRFQWTFPIMFSKHDPTNLYVGGSQLFRSRNEGASWEIVSPKLARNDPRTLGPSGGPITRDQTGVETYGVIFALAESPLRAGILWAGSDDGLIHISRDNSKTWTNVTPKGLPEFARVSIIEPSHYDAGTAYVAANHYQQDDKEPYLFKTTDYGRTWTRIDAGIDRREFTRVIREDPVRRGLLFAGTERGVWVSFDDGANWQRLQRNLPPVPIHDLAIKEGDLIAATHGRSFWVMDDISVLRQITPTVLAHKAHLFKPRDTYRENLGFGFGGGGGQHPVGANPPSGAIFYYNLAQANQDISIDILEANGRVVRTFVSGMDSVQRADSVRADQRRLARRDSLVKTGLSADSAAKLTPYVAEAQGNPFDDDAPPRAPRPPRVPNKQGINQFAWNLRYPEPVSFDGMILWAAGPIGPVAVPGTYQVRLRTPDTTITQSFVLKKDPRVQATQAELVAQFNAMKRIGDRFSDANNAVKSIRSVKTQVTDRRTRLRGPDSTQFNDIAGKFTTEISGVEAEVYQVKNQSSQDPLNYPIKLNNKIGALLGVVGAGDYAPTEQSEDVYDELSQELETQILKMNQSFTTNIPKLNAILSRNGLNIIVVPNQTPKPVKAM